MKTETMLEKIYEKYKDLKTEATADCKFEKSDLTKSFGTTQHLVKWINKKSEWSRVFRDLESKRKDAYRKAYEFYQTDYPLKLSTKDEYTLFIESDINYVEHMNVSLVVKEILQYIDSVI